MDAIPAIVPNFVPGIPPPVESVYSRPSTKDGNDRRNVFDAAIRGQAWGIAANFSETSTSLLSLRKAGTSRGRIISLTIEAVTQQCKSADGMEFSVKHVASLIRYFLGKQSDEQVTLSLR